MDISYESVSRTLKDLYLRRKTAKGVIESYYTDDRFEDLEGFESYDIKRREEKRDRWQIIKDNLLD